MLAWVIVLGVILAFQAAALPATTPAPEKPGPTCTLVDGGPNGGTFCNRWDGSATLTNTNWVTTGMKLSLPQN